VVRIAGRFVEPFRGRDPLSCPRCHRFYADLPAGADDEYLLAVTA